VKWVTAPTDDVRSSAKEWPTHVSGDDWWPPAPSALWGVRSATGNKGGTWDQAAVPGGETKMAYGMWARYVKEFFKFPNSTQTCKFKREAFPCSKNIQIVHEARLECFEQLSPLGQLQIRNRIHVINSGIEFNLNLPWILKGFKPCGKKLINSLKFYLNMVFTKVNLVGHTCM
jgi:hypothetical protein